MQFNEKFLQNFNALAAILYANFRAWSDIIRLFFGQAAEKVQSSAIVIGIQM